MHVLVYSCSVQVYVVPCDYNLQIPIQISCSVVKDVDIKFVIHKAKVSVSASLSLPPPFVCLIVFLSHCHGVALEKSALLTGHRASSCSNLTVTHMLIKYSGCRSSIGFILKGLS